MNLKDAFRYQNRLKEHMSVAMYVLENQENTQATTEITQCSAVMPDSQDVTTVSTPPSEYAADIDGLVRFLCWLFQIHSDLATAIRKTKKALPVDLDDAVSLNTQRRGILQVLNTMAALHESEVTLVNRGTAYRFNADGEQVSYRCNLKRTVRDRFSQELVRGYIAKWNTEVDDISGQIDRLMINSTVEFRPPFNVNDSFGDVLDAYLAGKLGA